MGLTGHTGNLGNKLISPKRKQPPFGPAGCKDVWSPTFTSVLDEPTFIWYIDPTAHSKFWSYIFCIDMCIIYIYDIIWSIMHLTWLYQWHDYINGQSSCFSVGLETDQFLDQVTSFSRMSGLIAILMPTSFLGKAVGPVGPVGPGVEMNSEGQGSPISPKVLGINDDALWRGSGGF